MIAINRFIPATVRQVLETVQTDYIVPYQRDVPDLAQFGQAQPTSGCSEFNGRFLQQVDFRKILPSEFVPKEVYSRQKRQEKVNEAEGFLL
ncbi:hypothetical protein [Vibrio variabilis]|uniref:hypothetical protein n=1 Tax=Vibrio variabilis TaxID=990271 RepID=UPI000DD9DDCA|nr:hypothetical protein [Vibrio variabilis]